jgi:hypothetical protein
MICCCHGGSVAFSFRLERLAGLLQLSDIQTMIGSMTAQGSLSDLRYSFESLFNRSVSLLQLIANWHSK